MTRWKSQNSRMSPAVPIRTWWYLLALVTGILLLGILSGCSSSSQTARELKLAPLAEMPDYVQTAPPNVQEAYRFAAVNPAILEHIPCYCGCGNMGHQHNLHCYVKSFNADGSVAEFDNHAGGCTLCVDITRDVMRMWQDGEALVNIRAYIDREYSRFGPPTNTAPVEVSQQ